MGFHWARSGKTFPYAMHCAGETVEVQGRYAFAVDDGNAYLAAGLAGLGVLWLPDYMAKRCTWRAVSCCPLFENRTRSASG